MHYFSKFQDLILKNRKKHKKNSIMKIDFQTSVKSDKKRRLPTLCRELAEASLKYMSQTSSHSVEVEVEV